MGGVWAMGVEFHLEHAYSYILQWSTEKIRGGADKRRGHSESGLDGTCMQTIWQIGGHLGAWPQYSRWLSKSATSMLPALSTAAPCGCCN